MQHITLTDQEQRALQDILDENYGDNREVMLKYLDEQEADALYTKLTGQQPENYD